MTIWGKRGSWDSLEAYRVADGEDEEGCGGGLEGAGHGDCFLFFFFFVKIDCDGVR